MNKIAFSLGMDIIDVFNNLNYFLLLLSVCTGSIPCYVNTLEKIVFLFKGN